MLNPVELAAYTREILDSLRLPPIDLPTDKKPGKMRGVDFYGRHLPEVMMECLSRYHKMYHRFPDPPLECKTLFEKIFWSKFFVPMPIPTAADRLALDKFIPKNLKNKVRPAKVYWISDRPNFPSSIKGADGDYYLKVNHFWRSARRIKFPILESERGELEELANSWLAKRNYNMRGGEWWYGAIKPKLYIEENISCAGEPCPEYKFLCTNGEIQYIYYAKYVDEKLDTYSIFDSEFSCREGANFVIPGESIKSDPPANAKFLLDIARQIGKQFETVRVDLYNSQNGGVILGELTLCTGAGLDSFVSHSLDIELGKNWDFKKYFL